MTEIKSFNEVTFYFYYHFNFLSELQISTETF